MHIEKYIPLFMGYTLVPAQFNNSSLQYEGLKWSAPCAVDGDPIKNDVLKLHDIILDVNCSALADIKRNFEKLLCVIGRIAQTRKGNLELGFIGNGYQIWERTSNNTMQLISQAMFTNQNDALFNGCNAFILYYHDNVEPIKGINHTEATT